MSDINFGDQPPLSRVLFDEAWHKERRRREYDIIRIVSPRQVIVKGKPYDLPPQDFFIMYDLNQYQKVPFGAILDVPRARAELYIEHKKDDIVNFVNQKMHDEFIADRRLKGFPDYSDKSVENRETYESAAYPKTNDNQIKAEIFDQLWLGLVIRAASDTPPQQDPRSGEVGRNTADEKIFNDLNNKMVEPSAMPVVNEAQPQYTPREIPVSEPPKQSAFSAMNEKLDVNEVTK